MKPAVLYTLGSIFAAIALIMTWQTLAFDPTFDGVANLQGLTIQVIYALTALSAYVVTAVFWGCGAIVEALKR